MKKILGLICALMLLFNLTLLKKPNASVPEVMMSDTTLAPTEEDDSVWDTPTFAPTNASSQLKSIQDELYQISFLYEQKRNDYALRYDQAVTLDSELTPLRETLESKYLASFKGIKEAVTNISMHKDIPQLKKEGLIATEQAITLLTDYIQTPQGDELLSDYNDVIQTIERAFSSCGFDSQFDVLISLSTYGPNQMILGTRLYGLYQDLTQFYDEFILPTGSAGQTYKIKHQALIATMATLQTLTRDIKDLEQQQHDLKLLLTEITQ